MTLSNELNFCRTDHPFDSFRSFVVDAPTNINVQIIGEYLTQWKVKQKKLLLPSANRLGKIQDD